MEYKAPEMTIVMFDDAKVIVASEALITTTKFDDHIGSDEL